MCNYVLYSIEQRATRAANKLQRIHNCAQLYKQYITCSNYFALVRFYCSSNCQKR